MYHNQHLSLARQPVFLIRKRPRLVNRKKFLRFLAKDQIREWCRRNSKFFQKNLWALWWKFNKKVKKNRHRQLLQIYLITQHFSVFSHPLHKWMSPINYQITLNAVKTSNQGQGKQEPLLQKQWFFKWLVQKMLLELQEE